MLLAKAMVFGSRVPEGATLLGYINRHPSFGGACAVLRMRTGKEVAWYGAGAIRSLPRTWRDRVKFTPADAA